MKKNLNRCMANKPSQHSSLNRFALLSIAVSAGFTPFLAHSSITNPSEPYISYTVQKGDKLAILSKKLLTDPQRWDELARINGFKNPHKISVGQVIDVPRSMINFALQPRVGVMGSVLSANGQVLVNGQAAKAGDVIAEGARIQTRDGSSATVKLSDGSSMQLMPRSLAEISTQHGYAMRDPADSRSKTWFSASIRLIEGLVDIGAEKTVRRKEPMTVSTPTSIIGVRGTQFRVAFEDPAAGTARTEVLEGKVRADNSVQRVGGDVNGGYGVAVKPNEREIKVVSLLPALPQSALPERINRGEDKQAVWTVAALSGAAGYRAELARDAAFAEIVQDSKSTQPSLDFSKVPNGNYFARVRGFDASGLEGYNAMRPVSIVDDVKVVWINEVHLSATAEYAPEGIQMQVYRASSDAPRNLQAEVSTSANMRENLRQLPINTQGQFLIPAVQAGQRLYLRFSGQSPSAVVQTSPIMQLDVPGNWGHTVMGMTEALMPLN